MYEDKFIPPGTAFPYIIPIFLISYHQDYGIAYISLANILQSTHDIT